MGNEHAVRVGIGVFVARDGKLLFGRRKGSHGAGEYACPGGHLEYGESFEECARREVREETGLEITNVRFIMVSNIDAWMPKHYIHIHLIAEAPTGEPELREPEKCDGWAWYEPDQIPTPRFGTIDLALHALRTKRVYFDQRDARGPFSA